MTETKVELVGLTDALQWAQEQGFTRAIDWLNALGHQEAASALFTEWCRRNPPQVMVQR